MKEFEDDTDKWKDIPCPHLIQGRAELQKDHSSHPMLSLETIFCLCQPLGLVFTDISVYKLTILRR